MILENVEQGAEIFTDFWRGYNSLKLWYKHRVVNKAKVGSGTSEYVTTNRVEGMWSNIKRILYVYSTCNTGNLQLFLDEAIWRLKYPSFSDRVNFLIQVNSFFNQGDTFMKHLTQDNRRWQFISDRHLQDTDESTLYEGIWDQNNSEHYLGSKDKEALRQWIYHNFMRLYKNKKFERPLRPQSQMPILPKDREQKSVGGRTLTISEIPDSISPNTL